ncbi:MAG: C-type lectin domain-containing protein [Selenomonadaceae bacterium]|nr:C-type lectin domain-containing protein [Selenomonadaceae bacterium]
MNLKQILCSTALISTLMISSAQANVLDGATEHNWHYYKAFEFGLNWKDAEAFCESMGGHLATAENSDENAVIQQVIDAGGKDEYFIGGFRDDRGIWRWISSGIITDQNWKSGYPNSSPLMTMKKKHEARWTTSYSWGDAKYPFICEWDDESKAHDSNW